MVAWPPPSHRAGHPLLEDARSAVRVISSASLDSLSAVQRTAAANAPAIQFVGGLGAAAVFGRMLLQVSCVLGSAPVGLHTTEAFVCYPQRCTCKFQGQ